MSDKPGSSAKVRRNLNKIYGPPRAFLNNIDKRNTLAIHQFFSDLDNAQISNILESVSSGKLKTLWLLVVEAAQTLPPNNFSLSETFKSLDETKPSEDEETKSSEKDLKCSEKEESLADEKNEVSIKNHCLPEDLADRTKIVVDLLKHVMLVFATKNIEPSNIISIVPTLKLILKEDSPYFKDVLLISELFWHKNWPGRDELAEVPVQYYLKKILFEDKAVKSDVKKLWEYKKSLVPTTSWFRNTWANLKQCVTNKTVLSEPKGCNLVIHLFLLRVDLTLECHEVIKKMIAGQGKQQAKAYGRIYANACLHAKFEIKQVLLEKCVQFLLWHFIRVQWDVESETMITLGFQLWELIVELHDAAKKHKVLMTFMLDAYEPILWRHLTISNNCFRVNAAKILFNLFPIERPDAFKDENEVLLMKQYSMMLSLLEDNCHLVRLVAVKEVCRILHVFWESLPHNFKTNSSRILITKLAFDESTPEMKKEVVHNIGMAIALGPIQLPVFFGPNLKNLQPLIFDKSKKVSRAMVNLLLAVQNLPHPSIKLESFKVPSCWEIVNPTDLVKVLGAENEDSTLVKPLVRLLFPSLHPDNSKKRSHLSVVKRVSWLIKQDINATRNFYKNSSEVLSLRDAVRFMQKILVVLTMVCRKKEKQAKNRPVKGKSRSLGRGKKRKRSEDIDEKENKNIANKLEATEEAEETSSADQSSISRPRLTDSLSMDDPEVIAGLIEVVICLWLLHQLGLSDPKNVSYMDKLLEVSKTALRLLLGKWRNSETVMPPLLMLASLMPLQKMRAFASYCMSQLRSFALEETEISDTMLNILLSSMCNWNNGDDILEETGDWMKQALERALPQRKPAAPKKKRQVVFQESDTPKPDKTLKILRELFLHPANHEYIVIKVKEGMKELICKLEIIKTVLKYRLAKGDPCETITDVALRECFFRYIKLIAYIYSKSLSFFNISAKYVDLLKWAEKHLVPHCDNVGLSHEEQLTDGVPLVALLLGDILRGASYIIHMDRADVSLCSRIMSFSQRMLQGKCAPYLVPGVLCVASALALHGVCVVQEKREGPVPENMLEQILPVIVSEALNKSDEAEKLSLALCEDEDASEMDTNVEAMFHSYFTHFEPNSEQIRMLCSSFLKATLKLATYEPESRGLPYAASYFFTHLMRSNVEASMLVSTFTQLVIEEFGLTKDGREAAEKVLQVLSGFKPKVPTAKIEECWQVLESYCGAVENSCCVTEDEENSTA